MAKKRTPSPKALIKEADKLLGSWREISDSFARLGYPIDVSNNLERLRLQRVEAAQRIGKKK